MKLKLFTITIVFSYYNFNFGLPLSRYIGSRHFLPEEQKSIYRPVALRGFNVGKFLAGFMLSHRRQQYSLAQLTVGCPHLVSIDAVDSTDQVTYRYAHKWTVRSVMTMWSEWILPLAVYLQNIYTGVPPYLLIQYSCLQLSAVHCGPPKI
jgi:hypothetical protein